MVEGSNVRLPRRATSGSAGFDLCAQEGGFKLQPGINVVPLGICVQMPQGTYGQLEVRSSKGKQGLIRVAGVIDEDYEGEVMVMIFNANPGTVFLDPFERFAQMIVSPYVGRDVAPLSDDQRGTGGFGSTGVL